MLPWKDLMDSIRRRIVKDIVIVGAGGFAREVAWLVEEINEIKKEWNLLGFLDENKENHGLILNGYPVIGGLEFLERNNIFYVCAIGNSKARKQIVQKIEKTEATPATLVHPSVMTSKKCNKIGEGTIICAASIITVNVNLGKHNIVNLDCTIGHDVVTKDFVTVYPSVNISGNCNIGECTELGTGTQIIQGKNIDENVIVGAGSVVVKDIEANRTVVGVPAKMINCGRG